MILTFCILNAQYVPPVSRGPSVKQKMFAEFDDSHFLLSCLEPDSSGGINTCSPIRFLHIVSLTPSVIYWIYFEFPESKMWLVADKSEFLFCVVWIFPVLKNNETYFFWLLLLVSAHMHPHPNIINLYWVTYKWEEDGKTTSKEKVQVSTFHSMNYFPPLQTRHAFIHFRSKLPWNCDLHDSAW